MKDIIELLQKERIKTVDALKHGNQQELSYLQQIDKALGWLKRIEEKGLEDVGCYLKLEDGILSVSLRTSSNSVYMQKRKRNSG